MQPAFNPQACNFFGNSRFWYCGCNQRQTKLKDKTKTKGDKRQDKAKNKYKDKTETKAKQIHRQRLVCEPQTRYFFDNKGFCSGYSERRGKIKT